MYTHIPRLKTHIGKLYSKGDELNENLAHWLAKSTDLLIVDITKVQLKAFIELT